jgi:hypothetical protein
LSPIRLVISGDSLEGRAMSTVSYFLELILVSLVFNIFLVFFCTTLKFRLD